MLALLLAAATVAGPPAPPHYCIDANAKAVYCGDPAAVAGPFLNPTDPVTVKLASDFGGELFRITFGAGLDLLSTGWAFQRCPGCFEGNAAGPNPDARFGLKVGGAAVAAAICWQAEKRGHHNFAKTFSWGVFGTQLAATVSNTIHAVRRR